MMWYLWYTSTESALLCSNVTLADIVIQFEWIDRCLDANLPRSKFDFRMKIGGGGAETLVNNLEFFQIFCN